MKNFLMCTGTLIATPKCSLKIISKYTTKSNTLSSKFKTALVLNNQTIIDAIDEINS